MRAIEAIFEHGHLTLLRPLPLQERQHVWLAILSKEPTTQQLAQLAAQSGSFRFLEEPAEHLYSVEDGQPV